MTWFDILVQIYKTHVKSKFKPIVCIYDTEQPLFSRNVRCLSATWLFFFIKINKYSGLKFQIKKLGIIDVLIKNGKHNSNRHQKSYLTSYLLATVRSKFHKERCSLLGSWDTKK